MSRVGVAKLIRTLTVVSTVIVYVIPLEFAYANVVRAILALPCTCMGGVCAFLYYKLDREEKEQVYKLSLLHLYSILMHPYLTFLAVLIINIVHMVSIF